MTSTAALDRASLVVGAGLAAAALALPAAAAGVTAAGVVIVVSWIVWRDGASYVIPDAAVAALALIGVAFRLAADPAWSHIAADAAWTDLAWSLASDVALTGGVLWLLREGFYRLRGHDGLGLGDVKLAAAAGCLIGASGFALALLAASVAGLLYALARGVGRTERIAFGVALAPAIGLVWGLIAFAPDRIAALGLAG